MIVSLFICHSCNFSCWSHAGRLLWNFHWKNNKHKLIRYAEPHQQISSSCWMPSITISIIYLKNLPYIIYLKPENTYEISFQYTQKEMLNTCILKSTFIIWKTLPCLKHPCFCTQALLLVLPFRCEDKHSVILSHLQLHSGDCCDLIHFFTGVPSTASSLLSPYLVFWEPVSLAAYWGACC